MKRIILWVIVAASCTTFSVLAQTPAPDHPILFRANEWNLDLFGSVSVGQDTLNNISGERVREDGRLGAGFGVSYFITRHLGIGGDAYAENTAHSFFDDASANVIFRIPFDRAHLAPYVYGGGGRQFDPFEIWFAQAGGGLEWRFTRGFGIFADARYVLTDEVRNFGLGRAGVRLSF